MNPERDEPASFSRGQLWGGAMHAWLGFVTLFTAATVVWNIAVSSAPFDPSTLAMSAYAAIWFAFFGGLISLPVTLIGLPVAGLVGYALRRVRARWIHLAVFAGFGVVVGAAVIGVFVALSRPGVLDSAMVTSLLAVCAAATAYGRWRAARTRTTRRPAARETDDLVAG